MHRSLVIAVLVILGIAVAGTAGWVFFGRDWMQAREEARVGQLLRNDPRTTETYTTIERRIVESKERPNDVDLYISVGNGWKSIVDQTGEFSYYRRAEDWYKRGIEASDGKNIVVMQNLAVVLRLDKRPEEAEQVLRRALEVNAGDPALYLMLVEVLRVDLKRDNKDIIDVYQSGIDHLLNNAPLVQSLAGYLEDIGRLEEALTYYELLAVKHPGFEQKIASLKQKIASQP